MNVLKQLLTTLVGIGFTYLGFGMGIVFFQVLFYLMMLLMFFAVVALGMGNTALKIVKKIDPQAYKKSASEVKVEGMSKSEFTYKTLFMTVPAVSINTYLIYIFNPYVGTIYLLMAIIMWFISRSILKEFWSK